MPEKKCRVLVIDDHEDTSEMLKLLLGEEDYQVNVALTIQEALSMATSGEFDLYVLDRRFPDGSGLDLCAQLNQVTPSVPCIFYSGDAYDIHRVEALAAGAHAYIAKPDIDGLIDKVNQIMAKQDCASAT